MSDDWDDRPRRRSGRLSVWDLRLRMGRDSDLSRAQLYEELGLDRLVIFRHVLRLTAGGIALLGMGPLLGSLGAGTRTAGQLVDNLVGGGVLLAIGLLVLAGSLLVSRRIRRIAAGRFPSDLRHPHGGPLQVTRLPAPDSLARQSVSVLRTSYALLMTVIPRLERSRPGIFAMAENTRLTLESRARRIVLIEKIIAGPTDGGSDADQGYGPLRTTLAEMAGGLRVGVQRYEKLVAQAVSAGEAWQSLEMDTVGATAATEELAAWEAGMREVQQIARVVD